MDVAVRPADDRWEVSNDDAGIVQLLSRLKTLEPALVLLEASGGLELPLVAALAAEELPVVVVNPRQVRNFARATGKLAKTDALDAAVLAHFGEAIRPPVRPLRDADTQVLSSLVARRHQLIAMLVSEKNRRSAASSVTVRLRIEAHIQWLERELDDLDTDLRQSVRNSPVWREKDDLLRTVPGVGEQVSLTLLAYLPEWADWIAGRSPPWWEWLRSTGTAAPCGADAPSGVGAPGSVPPCTWGRWWPAATTPSSGTSTSDCWRQASLRRWH